MRYHFGGFTLIVDRRELLRGTDVVAVAPQVFDLIEYLVRQRARVVTKDELIDNIWGGRVISETALTTRLYVARKAIGDQGTGQRLIKTLPRKGWRFVGAVQEDSSDTGAPRPITAPVGKVSIPALLPSVAVLPFTLLSGEFMPDSIGHRLAADVGIGLSKSRWLRVLFRSGLGTAFKAGGNPGPSGRDPEVRYMLHGSVQRVENRVRVTGQLVDSATGVTLWGDRYDWRWVESLVSYDAISGSVTRAAVKAIIHAEHKRSLQRPADDQGAWEAYQLGLWHLSKADAAENRLAGSLFQRAIDKDPNFGPAYGALAWSHTATSSAFSGMTVAESCELGEPLIRKAIALDDSDPEPHARLALMAMLKGDLGGAVEEADQILTVDAHCGDALGVKGAALVYAGRWREGRAALRQYFALGPRDIARPLRLTQIAVSLYLEGGYEAAAATARQVIRHFPQHPFAYRWLAASLGQLGRNAEASETLQALRTRWPTSFEMYVNKPPPHFCSSEYKPMLAGLRKAGWKE